MRIPSMIASVVVLIAVIVALSGLMASGIHWWELVKMLFPVAVGVTVVSWLIFQFGLHSVRWLNRSVDEDDEH